MQSLPHPGGIAPLLRKSAAWFHLGQNTPAGGIPAQRIAARAELTPCPAKPAHRGNRPQSHAPAWPLRDASRPNRETDHC